MKTDFVLDALEQALCARKPDKSGLIHHSDKGSLICMDVCCTYFNL
jgi:transposase InsO family protein